MPQYNFSTQSQARTPMETFEETRKSPHEKNLHEGFVAPPLLTRRCAVAEASSDKGILKEAFERNFWAQSTETTGRGISM
jgi:hypothetical protein